jgi:uncharacterized protein
MVAAQSKDVAFVVVISAPGVTSAELDTHAETVRLREDASPDNGARPPPARSSDGVSREDPIPSATLPPKGVKALNHAMPWASAQDHNPVTSWERVIVPVLAIYGSRDMSIPTELSANRIKEALDRAGNPDVTIKVFVGADHEIKVSGDPKLETEGKWGFPREAPGYLETMTEWLVQRVDIKS